MLEKSNRRKIRPEQSQMVATSTFSFYLNIEYIARNSNATARMLTLTMKLTVANADDRSPRNNDVRS